MHRADSIMNLPKGCQAELEGVVHVMIGPLLDLNPGCFSGNKMLKCCMWNNVT